MNARHKCMWRIAIAALLGVSALRAEPFDRIAVTVGTRVIAESEVVQYIRCSAFLDGKVADLSGPSKRNAAAKVVDQVLLLDDAAATRAVLPTEMAVDSLIEPIRARYATSPEYLDALRMAGITEAELKAHLLAGLRMLRYTDLRFRPEIQISDDELRALYDSLPEPERAKHSFEESRVQLEEVLAGDRVMRSLDQWLEMTRHDASIVYRESVFK